jgi:hypothetical protein
MESYEEKNQKCSQFKKWLNKMIGDKKYFAELDENETYKILKYISTLTIIKNPSIANACTADDIADTIYSAWIERDYKKIYSNKQTNEFSFYNINKDKYYKQVKKEDSECTGFLGMKYNNYTITHFCNVAFVECTNYVNYHLRQLKFQNDINSLSLDFENENNINISEMISDDANCFSDIEEDYDTKDLLNNIENKTKNTFKNYSNFKIVINHEELELNAINLTKLYLYDFSGARLISKNFIKHIIKYEGETKIDATRQEIKNLIRIYKNSLIDNNVVVSNPQHNGRKEICYGAI